MYSALKLFKRPKLLRRIINSCLYSWAVSIYCGIVAQIPRAIIINIQKKAIISKPKHDSTKNNCSSVQNKPVLKLGFSTGLRVRSCFWKRFFHNILWGLPGVSSFCPPRSGRSAMALSWSEELSPGSQTPMCPCTSWGKACCCSLLSSATAEPFWGCLTIFPCWPTPTAMGLELR